VVRRNPAGQFDHKILAKELTRRGMLKPDSQDKSTTPTRIPGSAKKVRMYRFTSMVLVGLDAEDEAEVHTEDEHDA
jgi:hypothetical protein